MALISISLTPPLSFFFFFFFFNYTATTEIYTLSLHDALPISRPREPRHAPGHGTALRPARPSRGGGGPGDRARRGDPHLHHPGRGEHGGEPVDPSDRGPARGRGRGGDGDLAHRPHRRANQLGALRAGHPDRPPAGPADGGLPLALRRAADPGARPAPGQARLDRHDDGRRRGVLAPRLRVLAVHGLVQPDRPARDDAAHRPLRERPAGRGPARGALRRRGHAVPPRLRARGGAPLVHAQARARVLELSSRNSQTSRSLGPLVSGSARGGRVLAAGAAPGWPSPSPARRIRRSSSGAPDSGGPLRGPPGSRPTATRPVSVEPAHEEPGRAGESG